MIRLSKCSKLFGSSLALDNITLEIDRAGLLLLIGGNGAGKSTLLKICAGIQQPTSGSVRISVPISYVGHQSMLYPQLTVAENMRFYGCLPADDQVAADSDWLETGKIEHKLVSELSQGQRARISLARALLAGRDRALLLDEPCAAMDQRWQQIFIEKMRGFARHRLIILVTHDPERYLDFASRVVILGRASLLADLGCGELTDGSSIMSAFRDSLR